MIINFTETGTRRRIATVINNLYPFALINRLHYMNYKPHIYWEIKTINNYTEFYQNVSPATISFLIQKCKETVLDRYLEFLHNETVAKYGSALTE